MSKISFFSLIAATAVTAYIATGAAAQECGGEVTVSSRNGVVTVEGDDAPNCIHLYLETDPGGQDHFSLRGGQGTTIAGGAGNVLTLLPSPSDVRRIKIDLGAGSDRVDVNDIDADHIDWAVRGGAGDDFLAFGRVTGRRIMLNGDRGDDTLVLSAVSAARTRVVGAQGTSDNLILRGEVSGTLSVAGVEAHEKPPLTCPLAVDGFEGPELLGLADLEVVSCHVDKTVDGTEFAFNDTLEATSLASGESLEYKLVFRTQKWMDAPDERVIQFVEAEVFNMSASSYAYRLGPFFFTPPYWLNAFEQCHELFIQACPDHLNTFTGGGGEIDTSGVQDIGPGIAADDGLPI